MRWSWILAASVFVVVGCTRDNTGAGGTDDGGDGDGGADLATDSTDLATGSTDLGTGSTDLATPCVPGASCGATVGNCVSRIVCIGNLPVCKGTFVAPSPTGNAANPGTTVAPLTTINAAIANAQLLGGSVDVCVCDPPAQASATYSEDITMVEGISLVGGFSCSNWSRSIGTFVTRIADTSATGVKFPAGLTAVTRLDGFTVVGVPLNAGRSAAVTVDDSSPTLVDDIVRGASAPVSVGLDVTVTAGAASPTVTRGSYTATASAGGGQIAVSLAGATATFTNVTVGGGAGVVAGFPATVVGLSCDDCGATSFTGGSINGGNATDAATGVYVTSTGGGTTDPTFSGTSSAPVTINGGSVSKAAGVGRAVYLDTCNGTASFTNVNLEGGFGGAGTRVGIDGNSALCGPSVSGGRLSGCETGGTCIGLRLDGAPGTVSQAHIFGTRSQASVAAFGVQCSNGGCSKIAGNNISAGISASGAAVELLSSSPAVDANQMQAPACVNAGAGPYYGLHIRGGAPVATNNVIRDNSCFALQESVRYEKLAIGPAQLDAVVVNNTVEYTTCTMCGERHGIGISGLPGGVSNKAGFVNNNIVRNTASGGTSWAVYQWDTDSDVREFLNNDLYEQGMAPPLFFQNHTTTLSNAATIDALVPSANKTLSADPLFAMTNPFQWHLTGLSPCRNTGSSSHAPATDRDGDLRPNPIDPMGVVVDVGADEFEP